jgi:hypothetical protein
MPWKECSVMDERLRFVARLLDGESLGNTETVSASYAIGRGYCLTLRLQRA